MNISISPSASQDQKRVKGESLEAEEGVVGFLDGHPHEKEMSGCQSSVLDGPKAKPKRQSAQAVLSPRADGGGEKNPENPHTSPHTPAKTVAITTHKLSGTGEIAQPPQSHSSETHNRAATHTLPTNTSTYTTSHTGTQGPGEENERDKRVEEKEEGERQKEERRWMEERELPRTSLWRLRDRGLEERWAKVRGEWRRSGSLERTSQEQGMAWEREGKMLAQGMAWEREGKMLAQDDRVLKDCCREGAEEGERAKERSEGEGQRRVKDMVQNHILSRVLVHSASSSSSSSSFNCSSPESDEVFSEGEETAARRKIMKRCRSWRTFLTMMQWSKRRQSSWVQLAGHQGNFQLSEGGEVLKRWSEIEAACLHLLMSDALREFVPRYYGPLSRNGSNYLRLEDLLSGLSNPVIMDCKMGVRTYLEEEIIKARISPVLRSDMYHKMVKVDPSAPLAEEHVLGAVTKLRYMQWRDAVSSTTTLGFRIEGIMLDNGTVLRDFNKTQSLPPLIDAFLTFTKSKLHILRAYQSRLLALREALKESGFFSTHEVIGSSLLFVHDTSRRANIWMIDFGKTMPIPNGVQLQHDMPWVEGNHEDGYLTGLASIMQLLSEAIQRARGGCLERSDSQTLAEDEVGMDVQSGTG
ncbi:hypothetical protein ACEWY4_015532 [Coilia grayii]|uniref:Kinase n=1 Tax=Coilia grayii TaxID=363190 RepID=A0ABD1JN97_9TELE